MVTYSGDTVVVDSFGEKVPDSPLMPWRRAEQANRLAVFSHGTLEVASRAFHNDCRCSL